MRQIITDRLILNNFTKDDTEDLYELIIDYRKSQIYKYDHKWPESLIEYNDIVKWLSDEDDYLAVRKMTDRAFIGFVNITKGELKNRYNLGFIFNTKYHNNGYAFEACQSYMVYLRSLNREIEFITGTAKDNVSANKLLVKLGFKVIKESYESFQTDEQNNPIIFQGYEYTCK